MPVKLLTSGGGGVNLVPSSSIASDQTIYLPTSGTSGGTVLCTDSTGGTANGVLYLNGSKQVTSGSGLVFDASGNLLVGTTTSQSGVSLLPSFARAGSSGIDIKHPSGIPSGDYYVTFQYANSVIGSITQNGTTAVQYSTTSDHRLKTNVRDADAKSFGNVKFRDFEWIDGRHDCGVIAHELQEVYPDLVLGEKDATEIRTEEIAPAEYETVTIPAVLDAEGNEVEPERTEQKLIKEAVTKDKEYPVYQQVNYMGLICRMGTVIQQQAKAIESLTQRIEALEYTKQGE